MTGLDMKVSALPWEQIQKLRLLGSDQGILLFKDFLDLVKGRVPLLIEVKNEGSVGRLEAAIIEDLKDYHGDFALQSFNPFVLQYFKKYAPELTRGQLSGSYKGTNLALWKEFLLRYLLMNHISSPHFVAYQTGTFPKWMANRLRQKGLYLLTWTVKNIDEYHRDKAIIDNVIFEGFEPPGV